MRRIIAVLLAAVLLFSLTACEKNNHSGHSTEDKTQWWRED